MTWRPAQYSSTAMRTASIWGWIGHTRGEEFVERPCGSQPLALGVNSTEVGPRALLELELKP